MSVETMRLAGVLSADAVAAENVFSSRYGLQVIWVDTAPVSAKVVECEVAYYRTIVKLVDNAVSQINFRSYVDSAVAPAANVAYPNPAITCFSYSFVDQVENGHTPSISY